MKRAILLLTMVAMTASACGIKRPLLRPKDIPAYEKKRADKMKKFDTPAETPPPITADPTVVDMSNPAPMPLMPR